MLHAMANNDFGVGVIKPRRGRGATSELAVQQEAKREKTESSVHFASLPQRVAHSRFCFRNHTVHELKEKFPMHVRRWDVDWFFPNSQFGKLYIDEPSDHEFNVNECREKAKAMKLMGLKYVYLEHGATFEDAILQIDGKL